MKIAFDVGGVLSKYPNQFRALILALHHADVAGLVELHVISDMHDTAKIFEMLAMNNISIRPDRVHSADYKTHGEMCKAVLCDELHIDMLIDDFIGYVSRSGSPPLRLLVMPDPREPYYADDWKTDGSEGDFGRRNPPVSKRHPDDR